MEFEDQGVREIIDDNIKNVRYKAVNLRKIMFIMEKFKVEKIKVV